MTPLFKKDSPVLTSLSKIFERVQHDQMLVFSKSVLSDRLSGFLKGHSCTTALLKMTEDLRATLDNNIVLQLQWIIKSIRLRVPQPSTFKVESLWLICVEESNVLRLEIHTQIGEQSSMVFLNLGTTFI